MVVIATPIRECDKAKYGPSLLAILLKMIEPIGLVIIEVNKMLYVRINPTTGSSLGKNALDKTGAIKL